MPPKGSGHQWGRSGNPEKAKLRAYEWRGRNPEKLKFIQWANAVNMRDAPGRVTYRVLMEKMDDQGRKCSYCPADAEELDHILPIKLGGTNWPWNIQFVCRQHNRAKSIKHPLEFGS
jgi:5-methylcytosine-specific restriction endonuclease McrA